MNRFIKVAALLAASAIAMGVAGCATETEPNNLQAGSATVYTLSASTFANGKTFDATGTLSSTDTVDVWRLPTASDLPSGTYKLTVVAQKGLNLLAAGPGDRQLPVHCGGQSQDCVQSISTNLGPNQSPEPFVHMSRASGSPSGAAYYMYRIEKVN